MRVCASVCVCARARVYARARACVCVLGVANALRYGSGEREQRGSLELDNLAAAIHRAFRHGRPSRPQRQCPLRSRLPIIGPMPARLPGAAQTLPRSARGKWLAGFELIKEEKLSVLSALPDDGSGFVSAIEISTKMVSRQKVARPTAPHVAF